MDVDVLHNDSEPGLEVNGKGDEGKQTYKSFKKKYRKMRFKFEEVMSESNDLCMKEQNAAETAKRLAQENDQLLETLLEMNNCPQMPFNKRIDLRIRKPTPALSDVPSLITAEEHARISQMSNAASANLVKEIDARIKQEEEENVASKPPKAYESLLKTPHLTSTSYELRKSPEFLDIFEGHPVAYLTPEQVDEYLFELDVALGFEKAPLAPIQTPQQDLAARNPNSVINWLRRNEPKVFLQDGEGSEKSHGKPGSLRGAGKRASMPHPSKPDALEIVEEDGIGYDPTIAGLEPASKGKRKREDDSGYHPKLGAPDGKTKKARVSRKKKLEGDGTPSSTPNSKKGGKGKAKATSPVAAAAVDLAEPPTPVA